MNEPKTIHRFPKGVVHIPPSKSLGHRAVICAGLAAINGGQSHLQQLGKSEDISATQGCMEILGAQFEALGEAGRAQFKLFSVGEALTLDNLPLPYKRALRKL